MSEIDTKKKKKKKKKKKVGTLPANRQFRGDPGRTREDH